MSIVLFAVRNRMTETQKKKDKPNWPSWQHMVNVAQELGEYSKHKHL